MTLLSKSELENLLSETSKPCISIYMPAEKAGAETRQNPIRFKNLIGQAEEQLVELGLRDSDVNELLQEARATMDNYDFWQHQDEGLAVFIAPETLRYYRLPYNFAELVVVGNRPHLKPLLPVITRNSRFYLLALSQNQVKLFQGNHYSIKELELPQGVPDSLAEALKYDDPEKQLQFHSTDSSGSKPTFHGQGVGTTEDKEGIRRFLLAIDKGLQDLLNEEKIPLILAGANFLLPIYHEVNSYSNLLESGIEGNPEHIKPEELHRQAWQIIEPHLAAERQEAIAQFHESLNAQQASAQLEKIVSAAYNGQVDTLLIAADAQQWGKFDPQANRIELHAEHEDEDIDLLDYAAMHTFLQSGKVYILESDKMPEKSSIAAIFRYPVYDTQTSRVAEV
ncbi:baeRF7 domain-containing protein [Myxosarcina sp. GI1(2024)]